MTKYRIPRSSNRLAVGVMGNDNHATCPKFVETATYFPKTLTSRLEMEAFLELLSHRTVFNEISELFGIMIRDRSVLLCVTDGSSYRIRL